MAAKKLKIKIELNGYVAKLPLYWSQGGIRIADGNGNHVPKPTKTINDDKYLVEWMITNDEIGLLNKTFLKDVKQLIQRMKDIDKFAEDSKYSKRITKGDRKEIATFEGFKIYHYSEDFNSFEKELDSGIKVRITFKLGSYGLVAHPHMYVLIPFSYESLKIKNCEGEVANGAELGKGCHAKLTLTEDDVKEIILTLSHASNSHRNALISILKSQL